MTIQSLSSAAHRLYVTSLYRRSLRLAQNWYWRREEFREKALVIRAAFHQGSKLTNIKEVEVVLKNAEEMLAVYAHPQPFLYVDAPGGTKFERNAPFPEEVKFLCPHVVTTKRSHPSG